MSKQTGFYWQVKIMKKFYQFNTVTKLFEIIIFIMEMRIL